MIGCSAKSHDIDTQFEPEGWCVTCAQQEKQLSQNLESEILCAQFRIITFYNAATLGVSGWQQMMWIKQQIMSALPDVVLAMAPSLWGNFVMKLLTCLFKQWWLHSHATYLGSGVWVFSSSRRTTDVSQEECLGFSTLREEWWLPTKYLDNSHVGWCGKGIASQDDQFCLWISICYLHLSISVCLLP